MDKDYIPIYSVCINFYRLIPFYTKTNPKDCEFKSQYKKDTIIPISAYGTLKCVLQNINRPLYNMNIDSGRLKQMRIYT